MTSSGLPNVNVDGMVAAAAARTPDAPAVTAGDVTLTYAELADRARPLARHLASLGVGPDVLVGVYLDRSVDMVVALLAVARAGGAYLPLDPDVPAPRTAFMLADTGAPVVLTSSALAGSLPASAGCVVVCVDRCPPALADPPAVPVAHAPRDLAYLIYTSGSTGKPKGVEVPHRALANLLMSMAERPGIGSDDVLVAVTTLSFDMAAPDVWLPLVTGAHLVVAPRQVIVDPTSLSALLDDAGATVMQATPAMWRMLVDAGWKGRPGMKALSGGDVLSPSLAAALLARGVDLWNLYGPTETTIWSTVSHVGAEARPTIGRPIANTDVHVLGPDLRPVAPGDAGELCIGGAGLARGYLRRPELTAERFVAHPFRPGARLYRTGDVARWPRGGDIELLGRLDEQVKVRGFRVECAEVEAALEADPRVRSAVVVARDDRLVAYVVPDAARVDTAAARVAEWQQVWDAAQRRRATDIIDPTFDTSAWISSSTGDPIPREEMVEAVAATVARVRALEPKRVLELGCGTGLLLWRLAPHCQAYVGTDLSPATVAVLEDRLRRAEVDNVSLLAREAVDFTGVPDEPFDVVLADSVVQSFPTVDYFRRVLAQAVAHVGEGGAVVIGDVRSLPLLPAFHASVGRHDERELVLDPAFFTVAAAELPRVTHVDVLLKRAVHHNELSRFRYDVILHVGEPPAVVTMPRWLDWSGDALTVATLGRLLEGPTCEGLGVIGIPNGRVEPSGVDPEALWSLGDRLGYAVECSWLAADEGGAFDVAFWRDRPGTRPVVDFPGPGDVGDRPLANDPLAGMSGAELAGELRAALRRSLPEYMVPSVIVALDALPLTPNGKVDRRALPDPAPSRVGTSSPPRSAAERALVAIWSDVLGLDDVGVDENFFDVGGHSLLAVRVMSRVRTALGVDVSLRTMFDQPTVAALARAVEGAGRTDSSAAPAIAPRPPGLDAELPLTFGQEALWFLDQLVPDNPFYNVPSAYHLTGPLNVGMLTTALTEIVGRHESLRTTFGSARGRPFQRVHPAAAVTLEVEDLRSLQSRAADEEGRRRAREEASQPFDLAAGPLFRARLLRLTADDDVLLLTTHHIVFDGWSAGVLLRELSALYGGSALAPLPVQYPDFAVWQRRWLAGDVLARLLDHWEVRLRGAPVAPEVPTDHPRPPVPSYRGRVERFRIGAPTVAQLRDLGRGHGATLYMTLLAAFDVVLAVLARRDDIVVGGTTAGRVRAELEDLVGFFVNPLVLRTDLSGDPPFVDVLARVRATVLDAFDHQDAPFEKLVERLRPPRDLSRHPLFQVAFELQEDQPGPAALGGTIAVADLGGPTGAAYGGEVTARLDLELFVSAQADGGLDANLAYAVDLYEPATMARLVDGYRRVLDAVVADPLLRISTLTALLGPWR